MCTCKSHQGEAEAARLEQEARELERSSREASSNAARYGGIGVTFTSVLAASGIALRFRNLRLQRVFVGICSVLTVAAIVLTLLSPVTFSRSAGRVDLAGSGKCNGPNPAGFGPVSDVGRYRWSG